MKKALMVLLAAYLCQSCTDGGHRQYKTTHQYSFDLNYVYRQYETTWNHTNVQMPERVYKICSKHADRMFRQINENIDFYVACMNREHECYNSVIILRGNKDINDLPDYAQEKWDNEEIGYCALVNWIF